MPARDVFVRMVRAGGVASWAVVVPVAFLEFRDRLQNPARQDAPWPWGSLIPLAVGALLVWGAPWIVRRFRWPDDPPRAVPDPTTPAPVRLRSAWLLAAVAASGAALMALLVTTNVFGRLLAHELGWWVLAAGAVVPAAIVAFGVARSASADLPHREAQLLAVLRAGAVFGFACSVAGAGRFLDDLVGFLGTGAKLSEHDLPHFVEPALAPIVWVAWTVLVGWSLRRTAARGEPARPRHVFAAVAATMAIALVAPTAANAEGWRWRKEMYARAEAKAREAPPPVSEGEPPVYEFRSTLILDDLPDPSGFASRAAARVSGFAVLVVLAAVAGRPRRGARQFDVLR